MEVKPGYKQTEVGVIPEKWESVPAATIGRFRDGNGFHARVAGGKRAASTRSSKSQT